MTIVLFSVTKRCDTFLSEFFDLGAAVLQAARRDNVACIGWSRFLSFAMNLARTLVKQRRGGPEALSELDVRASSQVDRAQLKN